MPLSGSDGFPGCQALELVRAGQVAHHPLHGLARGGADRHRGSPRQLRPHPRLLLPVGASGRLGWQLFGSRCRHGRVRRRACRLQVQVEDIEEELPPGLLALLLHRLVVPKQALEVLGEFVDQRVQGRVPCVVHSLGHLRQPGPIACLGQRPQQVGPAVRNVPDPATLVRLVITVPLYARGGQHVQDVHSLLTLHAGVRAKGQKALHYGQLAALQREQQGSPAVLVECIQLSLGIVQHRQEGLRVMSSFGGERQVVQRCATLRVSRVDAGPALQQYAQHSGPA
mmetsp:Transcript_80929/g.249720  ORF Transcript_80929/g.249720 Transcript_80929/m.249720 type:complete len:283 (+) Transcript_80929:1764-2612(+)